jgi:hypothetical protein
MNYARLLSHSPRGGSQLRSERALLIGATLLLTACADSPTLVSPVSTLRADAEVIVNPDNQRWNRFDVVVDVAIDGPLAKTMAGVKMTRGFSYRVTRRRDSAGRWVSDLAVGALRPRSSNPYKGAPSPITRVMNVARFATPQLIDAAGQTRPLKPVRVPAAAIEAMARSGRFGLRRLPPLPTRPSPNAAMITADTSSEWIDSFLVTRKAAARIRGRVARGADRLQAAIGQSRFIRERNGGRAEIVVDDATGVIRETRTSENGRLRAVTVREYAQTASGMSVLKSERTTRYADSDGVPPMVITMTYRNIRMTEDR